MGISWRICHGERRFLKSIRNLILRVGRGRLFGLIGSWKRRESLFIGRILGEFRGGVKKKNLQKIVPYLISHTNADTVNRIMELGIVDNE